MQDDLAVRRRPEDVACCLQLAPQNEMVVDLTVGDHNRLIVLGDERLVAPGDIDHRQARVDQGHRPTLTGGRTVGTAVAQRRHDPPKLIRGGSPATVVDRRNAAHQSSTPVSRPARIEHSGRASKVLQ
jgi:hypothetical protein